jgi:hypothetical protein
MDRREFVQATIGFLGCSALKAEASEASPLILPPRLGVRNSNPERNDAAFAHIPVGEFFLAQDEAGQAAAYGKEIELEILAYRERAGIFNENLVPRFVTYDPADPEFVRIKAGSRHKGVKSHTFLDERENLCFWEVESLFRLDGIEGRMGHRGRTGMGFVLDVPVGSKVKMVVTEVKTGGRSIFARRTVAINGRPIVTDPFTGARGLGA